MSFIPVPDNITKDHIILAAKKLSEGGYDSKYESSTYDAIVEGNKFPPPILLKYASEIAGNPPMSIGERFKGGIGTQCFKVLEAQGFKVVKKSSDIEIFENEEVIENNSNAFALETHLEDFLVTNWKQTMFAKEYNFFGRQYRTDTGPLDILAVNKKETELLVIELKKGRASDSVVGQIQRYMGFVLEEVAVEGQAVKGIIVALEDDLRIRRALAVTNNIEFYRYQVNFELLRA